MNGLHKTSPRAAAPPFVAASCPEYDPARGWLGRPAWVELDLDAVAENVRRMSNLDPQPTKVMAVVKADGYGLGAIELALAALRGGASYLAVACADEGVRLRRAGIACPILILGPPADTEAPKIVAHDLIATVHTLKLACALSQAALSADRAAAVHLKLDTGLNRFGHRIEGSVEFAQQLAAMPGLVLDGLYTHFACADNPADPFTLQQMARFDAARLELSRVGINFAVVHADNSAGALAFPNSHYDMLRMGITLSGHYPSELVARSLALVPALTIKARIMRISTVEPGESIGYGRSYIASEPRRVALLPLGYADGYPRGASGKTAVLVRGIRCPLVGRISMDQLTVDVTDVPAVAEGDEAVLVGSQDGAHVGLDEIAAAADTISYELLTHLSSRLPRIYSLEGRVHKVQTLLGEWLIEPQQSDL